MKEGGAGKIILQAKRYLKPFLKETLNTMIIQISLIGFCFLLSLLYFEKKEAIYGLLFFKPALSALFVLSGWLQSHGMAPYAMGVLAGLSLSWIGDVCLIFSSRKFFLSGLIAFLVGHIFYASIFLFHGAFSIITVFVTVPLILFGIIIFKWLQPHLGAMKVPVICYMIVISLMLEGALAVFSSSDNSTFARYLVLIGATLFYLSDILVARDKFVAPGFINRLIGLPLYYAGQFLLSFSIGQF